MILPERSAGAAGVDLLVEEDGALGPCPPEMAAQLVRLPDGVASCVCRGIAGAEGALPAMGSGLSSQQQPAQHAAPIKLCVVRQTQACKQLCTLGRGPRPWGADTLRRCRAAPVE
jgi:hypothetical protein